MPLPLSRTMDKKALLAYKEKILNDIKYYEKRINEDLSNNASTAVNFEDSSDSEEECLFTIDSGPTVDELKSQQKALQTDLHATQELASLVVLQSRVDIMVEDPVFNGEPPVTQPGSWREVNADCRIDCVSFSTTFYVHQASGTFGPKSYRGLRVVPVKPAQEVELAKSVLTRVTTPSDALEVLRSYSVAHRSRRTTLSKLATKFGHNLYMEAMPGGGYILKCADLLEVSWVLENKWSPIAPFYHKMIFDLENMNECYIKTIRHAHKQLSDPATDTNQRTLLLARIITTCLEAKGTQDVYESMESETESVKNVEKRRSNLENEASEPKKKRKCEENDEIEDGNSEDNITDRGNINDEDNINKEDNLDQVMAPPKSLPKKVKPKGKENTDQNRKSVKRTLNENEDTNVKKSKIDKNDQNNARQSKTELNKAETKSNNKKDKDFAKNKDEVAINKINTEKSANGTESVKTKASEAKSNQNQNGDNADNINNKEKSAKNQIPKEKVAVIQNNNKVKNIKKAKVIKSKNGEENNRAEKENIDNVNIQEKQKQKVAKNMESDKVASNDKATNKDEMASKEKVASNDKATSKDKMASKDKVASNDNTTNKDEIASKEKMASNDKATSKDKMASKDKVASNDKATNKDEMASKEKVASNDKVASSKNDPTTKNKNLEPQKVSSKNKIVANSNNLKSNYTETTKGSGKDNIASSENDPKSKETEELNEENKIINSKNDQVTKNNAKKDKNAKLADIDDIPILSVNYIESVPKKDNTQKIAKTQKSTHVNEKVPKKDAKNDNKLANNAEPTKTAKHIKNKETNAQNVKKTIVNNATQSNTKPTDNAVSKNDKHSQNNNTNKAIEKSSKNNEKKLKNVQESNAEVKTKKDSVITTEVNKEIATKDLKNNEKNTQNHETARNQEITENNKQSNVVLTEKMTKFSNTANKNKHTANIANLKNSTKISVGKPKILIKTHKNVAASKKVGENLVTSSQNKNLKPGNIAEKIKNPSVKDNDSASKKTKIPMKLGHESLKKRNPLRISPRKLPSTFKCASDSNMKQKNCFTNIPRLLKKPEPKISK